MVYWSSRIGSITTMDISSGEHLDGLGAESLAL
jgi:hypothetical protein